MPEEYVTVQMPKRVYVALSFLNDELRTMRVTETKDSIVNTKEYTPIPIPSKDITAGDNNLGNSTNPNNSPHHHTEENNISLINTGNPLINTGSPVNTMDSPVNTGSNSIPNDDNANSPKDLLEVMQYCAENKINTDPKRFWNYYSRRNWVDKYGNEFAWKKKIREWDTYNMDKKIPKQEWPETYNADNSGLEKLEKMFAEKKGNVNIEYR